MTKQQQQQSEETNAQSAEAAQKHLDSLSPEEREQEVERLRGELEKLGMKPSDLKKKNTGNNYERKHPELDFSKHVIQLSSLGGRAWNAAIKHAAIPVQVVDATMNMGEGNHELAVYTTDTGRAGRYYFIAVDRWGDGFRAVEPVSELYEAVPHDDVVKSLRDSLKEAGIKSKPVEAYLSESGGRYDLEVELPDMTATIGDETLYMRLVLMASLDRTKAHTLTLMPVTEDGTPFPISFAARDSFDFRARHTTSLPERLAEFQAGINHIVENWQETIVPYLDVFNDGEYDVKMASELLESLVDESELTKKHVEAIKTRYHAAVAEKGSNDNPGLLALKTAAGYIEEASKNPVHLRSNRESLAKGMGKALRKQFRKMSKDESK